jgi:hypothetical protein
MMGGVSVNSTQKFIFSKVSSSYTTITMDDLHKKSITSSPCPDDHISNFEALMAHPAEWFMSSLSWYWNHSLGQLFPFRRQKPSHS